MAAPFLFEHQKGRDWLYFGDCESFLSARSGSSCEASADPLQNGTQRATDSLCGLE